MTVEALLGPQSYVNQHNFSPYSSVVGQAEDRQNVDESHVCGLTYKNTRFIRNCIVAETANLQYFRQRGIHRRI